MKIPGYLGKGLLALPDVMIKSNPVRKAIIPGGRFRKAGRMGITSGSGRIGSLPREELFSEELTGFRFS